MTNNINVLTMCLIVASAVLVLMLIILAFVYASMKAREKRAEEKPEIISDKEKNINKMKTKQYTIGSVTDFMEFDKVEDNMIIQRNGTKFTMVIECQGVNYDLMSEDEKVGVEEGFNQFLNTLTGPIQIYTQTRKINLEGSIKNYQDRVNGIEMEYERQKIRYNQLSQDENISTERIKQEYIELIKLKNLTEYGKDIVYNTEKMSLSKNILTQKYYVAVSTFSLELGQGSADKEEMKEMAFSDLYTKAQSLIRALAISGVVGKVMTSTELADLLYVAYNREDSDVFGMGKAIRARYDELYTTAPDYMNRKMELLNKEINEKSYDLANRNVIKAQTEIQKQYENKKENMDDIIANLAKIIIEQNKRELGNDVAKEAISNVEKENKGKEKKENVQEEKTSATRRVTSSAK